MPKAVVPGKREDATDRKEKYAGSSRYPELPKGRRVSGLGQTSAENLRQMMKWVIFEAPIHDSAVLDKKWWGLTATIQDVALDCPVASYKVHLPKSAFAEDGKVKPISQWTEKDIRACMLKVGGRPGCKDLWHLLGLHAGARRLLRSIECAADIVTVAICWRGLHTLIEQRIVEAQTPVASEVGTWLDTTTWHARSGEATGKLPAQDAGECMRGLAAALRVELVRPNQREYRGACTALLEFIVGVYETPDEHRVSNAWYYLARLFEADPELKVEPQVRATVRKLSEWTHAASLKLVGSRQGWTPMDITQVLCGLGAVVGAGVFAPKGGERSKTLLEFREGFRAVCRLMLEAAAAPGGPEWHPRDLATTWTYLGGLFGARGLFEARDGRAKLRAVRALLAREASASAAGIEWEPIHLTQILRGLNYANALDVVVATDDPREEGSVAFRELQAAARRMLKALVASKAQGWGVRETSNAWSYVGQLLTTQPALFDPSNVTHQLAAFRRLQALTPDNVATWPKIGVGQILHGLAAAIKTRIAAPRAAFGDERGSPDDFAQLERRCRSVFRMLQEGQPMNSPGWSARDISYVASSVGDLLMAEPPVFDDTEKETAVVYLLSSVDALGEKLETSGTSWDAWSLRGGLQAVANAVKSGVVKANDPVLVGRIETASRRMLRAIVSQTDSGWDERVVANTWVHLVELFETERPVTQSSEDDRRLEQAAVKRLLDLTLMALPGGATDVTPVASWKPIHVTQVVRAMEEVLRSDVVPRGGDPANPLRRACEQAYRSLKAIADSRRPPAAQPLGNARRGVTNLFAELQPVFASTQAKRPVLDADPETDTAAPPVDEVVQERVLEASGNVLHGIGGLKALRDEASGKGAVLLGARAPLREFLLGPLRPSPEGPRRFEGVKPAPQPGSNTKNEDGLLGEYLFTVEEDGVRIALRFDPDRPAGPDDPNSALRHTNLSRDASMGGEVWFHEVKEGGRPKVTLRATGPFGIEKQGEARVGTLTLKQWEGTLRLWEDLGYDVESAQAVFSVQQIADVAAAIEAIDPKRDRRSQFERLGNAISHTRFRLDAGDGPQIVAVLRTLAGLPFDDGVEAFVQTVLRQLTRSIEARRTTLRFDAASAAQAHEAIRALEAASGASPTELADLDAAITRFTEHETHEGRVDSNLDERERKRQAKALRDLVAMSPHPKSFTKAFAKLNPAQPNPLQLATGLDCVAFIEVICEGEEAAALNAMKVLVAAIEAREQDQAFTEIPALLAELVRVWNVRTSDEWREPLRRAVASVCRRMLKLDMQEMTGSLDVVCDLLMGSATLTAADDTARQLVSSIAAALALKARSRQLPSHKTFTFSRFGELLQGLAQANAAELLAPLTQCFSAIEPDDDRPVRLHGLGEFAVRAWRCKTLPEADVAALIETFANGLDAPTWARPIGRFNDAVYELLMAPQKGHVIASEQLKASVKAKAGHPSDDLSPVRLRIAQAWSVSDPVPALEVILRQLGKLAARRHGIDAEAWRDAISEVMEFGPGTIKQVIRRLGSDEQARLRQELKAGSRPDAQDTDGLIGLLDEAIGEAGKASTLSIVEIVEPQLPQLNRGLDEDLVECLTRLQNGASESELMLHVGPEYDPGRWVVFDACLLYDGDPHILLVAREARRLVTEGWTKPNFVLAHTGAWGEQPYHEAQQGTACGVHTLNNFNMRLSNGDMGLLITKDTLDTFIWEELHNAHPDLPMEQMSAEFRRETTLHATEYLVAFNNAHVGEGLPRLERAIGEINESGEFVVHAPSGDPDQELPRNVGAELDAAPLVGLTFQFQSEENPEALMPHTVVIERVGERFLMWDSRKQVALELQASSMSGAISLALNRSGVSREKNEVRIAAHIQGPAVSIRNLLESARGLLESLLLNVYVRQALPNVTPETSEVVAGQLASLRGLADLDERIRKVLKEHFHYGSLGAADIFYPWKLDATALTARAERLISLAHELHLRAQRKRDQKSDAALASLTHRIRESLTPEVLASLSASSAQKLLSAVTSALLTRGQPSAEQIVIRLTQSLASNAWRDKLAALNDTQRRQMSIAVIDATTLGRRNPRATQRVLKALEPPLQPSQPQLDDIETEDLDVEKLAALIETVTSKDELRASPQRLDSVKALADRTASLVSSKATAPLSPARAIDLLVAVVACMGDVDYGPQEPSFAAFSGLIETVVFRCATNVSELWKTWWKKQNLATSKGRCNVVYILRKAAWIRSAVEDVPDVPDVADPRVVQMFARGLAGSSGGGSAVLRAGLARWSRTNAPTEAATRNLLLLVSAFDRSIGFNEVLEWQAVFINMLNAAWELIDTVDESSPSTKQLFVAVGHILNPQWAPARWLAVLGSEAGREDVLLGSLMPLRSTLQGTRLIIDLQGLSAETARRMARAFYRDPNSRGLRLQLDGSAEVKAAFLSMKTRT